MHFRPKALLAENQIELWLICAVVKIEAKGHSILHTLNCAVRHKPAEVWRLIHRRAGQKLPLSECRLNSPLPGEDCLSFSFFFFFRSLESPSLAFRNAIQQGDNNVAHMQNVLAVCKTQSLNSGEDKADKMAVMKDSTTMARGWYWGF